MKPWLYGLGAYVVYPALAAAGALLLSSATSPAGIAAASTLLAAALFFPALLGAYCRRCGERALPRLLRIIIMPAAIFAALTLRSASSPAQYAALGLLALSVIVFGAAFRLTYQETRPRQY